MMYLVLDRSKAEMDLKELSETVQQQQGAQASLTSPKRQIRSRFQLNLDKTIESCKAQLGELIDAKKSLYVILKSINIALISNPVLKRNFKTEFQI